jgi:hypothetical protein
MRNDEAPGEDEENDDKVGLTQQMRETCAW